MKTFPKIHLARCVLAVLAIASLPGTAGARPLHDPTERIVVRDLDLTTAAGITKLDRRIRAAAHRVCVPEKSFHPFVTSQAVDRCITKAVADAAGVRETVIRRATFAVEREGSS